MKLGILVTKDICWLGFKSLDVRPVVDGEVSVNISQK